MRQRIFAWAVAGFLGALCGTPAFLACGGARDDADSSGADLSAAPAEAGADTPIALAKKRLVGVWLPTSGDSGELALVVSGTERLTLSRDVPHQPVAADDRQDVTRTSAELLVQAAMPDGTGTVRTTAVVFIQDVAFLLVEDYTLAFGSDGGDDTLTLTETASQLTSLLVPIDGGPGPVDAGTPAVRPPLRLTRAASWCARPISGQPAANDCATELDIGVFKPTDMPPECVGNEALCLSCEAHACKTHHVSSCELARHTCRPSVEACEFQDGHPAGQVTTVDFHGAPIDCAGSPHGASAVCCEDFDSRGGDDD